MAETSSGGARNVGPRRAITLPQVHIITSPPVGLIISSRKQKEPECGDHCTHGEWIGTSKCIGSSGSSYVHNKYESFSV